jgi:PTS system nitrogen regulatory IIA component
MKVSQILKPEAVIPRLKHTDREGVLRELTQKIVDTYDDPHLDFDDILRRLLERERLGSTGIGGGLAIPHGRINGIDRMYAALGVSEEGVSFHAIDQNPSHLFFVLLTHENSTGEHLKALARVCRLFKGTELVQQLLEQDDSDEIYKKLTLRDQQL